MSNRTSQSSRLLTVNEAAEDRDALLATRLSEATQGHFSSTSGTQVARPVEAAPTVTAVN